LNDNIQTAFQSLLNELGQHILGQQHLLERLVIALLADGHLLVEGAPGLAKTRAIKTLARLIDGEFQRIQFTPDLLPSDITGTDVYRPDNGSFDFFPGPLFHNLVLADEINRAPAKVQSALLEAMGEHQITTGGVTRALDEPFLVAATQNPIEHEGTYPLPEAQMDRFMFFLELSMPDAARERLILDRVLLEQQGGGDALSALLDNAQILQARHQVRAVHLSDAVRDYIVRLTAATRGEGAGGTAATAVAHAASPRGSIHLANAAQARAWLNGNDYVSPDDVAALAPDVLSGRIGLHYKAQAEGMTARTVMNAIIEATPKV